MKLLRKAKGLSLIELLTITVILVILAVAAIPNFVKFMQRYRLVSTMQGIYYNLQYARSEAIKGAVTVYISFQTGSSWCYGINSGSACTCTNPSSCNLGAYTSPSTLTTLSQTGLSSLNFEGSRGAASSSGTLTLTVTGGTASMGIDIGRLGNIHICSNNISGYPAC